MPKVSIVIPVHNAERFLAHTIESVRSQTFCDWELVIVDDGSRDNSYAHAEEFAHLDRRIRVVAQDNGGVAAARDRGLAETDPHSVYVAFLDHDDVWRRDALEQLIHPLDTRRNIVAAYGLAYFIDSQGRPFRWNQAEQWTRYRRAIVGESTFVVPLDASLTFSMLVFANVILTPGQVLIRRSILEAVGRFDDEAVPADDYDMWIRLALHGDLAFLDRTMLGFRQHESNTSHNSQLMNAAEGIVRRKLLTSPELDAEQRYIATIGWQLWRPDHSLAQILRKL